MNNNGLNDDMNGSGANNGDRAGSTDPEEAGLSRSLKAAADVPVPGDLSARVLDRPALQGGRRSTSAVRTRRIWSVVGVAAAVAAVAIGVTAVNTSSRDDAPSAAAGATSSSDGSASAGSPAKSSAGSPSATEALVDPTLPRGDYQPWSQQLVPCGGIDPVDNADQALLNPEVGVAGAVVCDTTEQPVDGDGVWLLAGERELAPAQVTALVEALTAENVPIDPAAMCTADYVSIPDFALVLDDGRVVRPGVPGDGCHPSRDAAAILAPTGDVVATTQVRQLRTQAMVDAGCDPAGPTFWDPFSSGGTGAQGERPQAPTSGGSVCLYESSGDSPENMSAELVALGTPAAADLTKALNDVLDAQVKPGPGCASAENAYLPAEAGWLTVVAPAADGEAEAKGSNEIVLSVELGGCHRVLSGGGVGWFAPGPAVDALAALADEPVVLT